MSACAKEEIPERAAEPFVLVATRGTWKLPAKAWAVQGESVVLTDTPTSWRYDGNCGCRRCAGRPKRAVA